MAISEEELKELKEAVSIVDVVSKFTDLRRKGKLFEGLCPFHNDTEIGSFKVDPRKGTYKCYACGSGGDAITFLTNTGTTFKRAVEVLRGNEEIEGEVLNKSTIEYVELAEFSYIEPLAPINPKDFKHPKLGDPKNIYTYMDENGFFLGYVLRYEDENGKKHIFPYNYGKCTKSGYEYEYKGQGCGKFYNVGDIVHKYLGFGERKPIYGLERLKKYPKANVVIVEGEKCVDFLQKRFNANQVIFISWQSGTNNVDKVDWSVLNGRRVFLIPDNDWSHTDKDGTIKTYIEQPSPKAFNHIRETISSIVSELNWVKLKNTRSQPCGWDLADTNWDAKQIGSFIKENNKLILNHSK